MQTSNDSCRLRALAAVAAAAVTFCGCCVSGDPRTRDRLDGQSLREVKRDRDIIASAVDRANTILGPEVSVRFAPPGQRASEPSAVHVFEVEPTALKGTFGPCTTLPDRPPIVVVDIKELKGLCDALAGPRSSKSKVPADELLAILLLHEAGHLQHNHRPVVVPPSNGATFNNLENRAKEIETEADRFAARQIGDALAEDFPSPRMPAAVSLAVLLTNVSFNLLGTRVIDNFGASAIDPRSMFWDTSYSHPNTELRFLVINDELHPSETGKALIESFLAGRARGGKVSQ